MSEYHDNVFDAIIVDTNAFDAKDNDFCGIIDNILPKFFATIQKLRIRLLSHPILEGETLQHVYSDDFKTKPEQAIKSLIRNKNYLQLVGFEVDKAIGLLQTLDLCKKAEEAYRRYYGESTRLPYANPEMVFEKYFANKPPFAADSNKKAEFPDAFVLGALENYLELNSSERVLVVTKDGDWISTLTERNYENVYLTETIDSALRLLNKHERIVDAFDAIYSELDSYITKHAAEDVWFELNDYDCTDDIDVERVKIYSYSCDMVPLLVNDDELIFQVELIIAVDGITTITDYDNSVWDREDNCFLFTSYSVMDFKNALGEVTAEIHIKINENQTPLLSEVKLIAPHGLRLTIDEEQTHFTNASFDVEADQMDSLEEYYRH